MTTAVVGAGIAGLVVARELARAGERVALYEAAPRLGGVVHTVAEEGFLVEAGPDGFSASLP